MRRLALVLALCGFPATAAVSEDNLKVYSDICYNVEGGDALGTRIGVVTLSNATYAFLQLSEGYPDDKPQMSVVSDVDLKKGKLVFSVMRDNAMTTFRGTMTAKALTGTFSPKWPGDPKVFQLRRVPARQKFADCK